MASRNSGMEKTKIMKINRASGVILQFSLSDALCTELARECGIRWQEAHFIAIYGCSANLCLTLESSGWEGVESARKEQLWNPKSSAAEPRLRRSPCPQLTSPSSAGVISALILAASSECALCAFGSHGHVGIALRRP